MPELDDKKSTSAKQQVGRKTIADYLESPDYRQRLARSLPAHIDSDRFHTLILGQVASNEKLAQCTPRSVILGSMQIAALGLEIGVGGEAWLVPYENSVKLPDGSWTKRLEAAVQVGYLGHLALAYRSGLVKAVQANYVMKGDHFRHQNGTHGLVEHIPADDRSTDPKDLTHAYGIIETIHGGMIWWVLTRKEIERIRLSSPSKNSPAWGNWYMEMAVGKALKRALKFAPKTRQMSTAIEMDDEHDAGVPQRFDIDASGLLPAEIGKSEAEAQATQMMDAARAATAKKNQSAAAAQDEGPPDDDGDPGPGMTVPAEIVDDRELEPVPAKKTAAKPPAAPAQAPTTGGMGW